MRYFVTGGAGFIGSNYVEHLLNKVEGVTAVTVYDKFTYAASPKNFQEVSNDPRLTVIKGDICDASTLEDSISEHDVVLHFAAESHVDRSITSSDEFIHSNILSAFKLLRVFHEKKGKIIISI